MRSPLRIPLAAALLTLAATPVLAQTTIGSSTNNQDRSCVNTRGGSSTFVCGQTFVVPVGDNVLQSFSFGLSTSNSISFQLYAFGGDRVVGSALFTQAVGPTAGFQTITFSPPGGLALTSGGSYAAVLSAGAGTSFHVQTGNPATTYTSGGFIGCYDGVGCPPSSTVDATFSATFVAAGPVSVAPEPTTLALLGGGLASLAGLGAVRRRRPSAA